uniref:C-type lectin domain-containing protein n=1 Tax=Cyprinus carpio TaxID=7962 RepID=A0A8C1UDX5_CYPCA
ELDDLRLMPNFVVLKVERALYIHSPHLQFLPARDSNSQPLDCKSNTLTVRPRLAQFRGDCNKQWLFYTDGWIYYQYHFYYMSTEMKSWTESRKYCTERGADLIIINNRQEQEFVKNISGGAYVWIGLTNIDVDGSWKWVDGSTLTSWFLLSGKPSYPRYENCARSCTSWWTGYSCNNALKWICERSILQIALS